MNKKLVIGVIIAIAVIILGVIGYTVSVSNSSKGSEIKNNDEVIIDTENGAMSDTENANQPSDEVESGSSSEIKTDDKSEDVPSSNVVDKKTENVTPKEETINEVNKDTEDKSVLVVYYSAQSHTKSVAERIANNLNADIFEIVPKDVYTSEDLDWTDSNSRVLKEHEDTSLRNVELENTEVENWEKYDTVLIGYPIWWGIAAWPMDTFVKANDFTGKTVIPFCTSASSGLGQSGELLEKEAGSGNWLEGHRFRSNPSNDDIDKWTESIK